MTQADMPKKKNKFLPWLIVAIVAVAIAAPILHHKLGPYHFKTVTKDVLYRSGSLRPYNFEKIMKQYHIKTVVSMRLPDEGDWMPDWYEMESQFCQANGIRFVNIPIKGKELPTTEQVQEWLDIVKDKDNQPVLVHCAQGVIRTGVMVALYRIACEQTPNKQAWDELPTFGHDFEHPKILALRDFVMQFNPEDYGAKQVATE